LSLGARGEAVRILQEHLINAGYLDKGPNGYYGFHTADPVSHFQKITH
jgi:peptidoglycan hydrolase-like protein with peptidoglycan-binding domain